MTEKQFVEMIGPLAAADMQQSGILASVTAAQACLESGYGSTDLAQNANNLFGMKCILSGNTWESVWDGANKYTKQTKEQDTAGNEYTVTADFRKYPDISASIRDHSLYLTQAKKGSKLRYAGLVGCRDYKTAAQIIKDGGYATDVQYVQKICSLIERWDLTQYDVEEEETLNIIDVISAANVPRWGNQKKFIAIHYLGVVGQSNKVEAGGYGAHYYIYWDGTVYQAADHDAILWQVGTGGYYTQKHPTARNANTIGIELCCKCDGNSKNATDPYWYFTEETQEACVQLVKKLMTELGIPAENVLRHYDIVNKHCPAPYVNNNGYKTSWTWEQFREKLTGVATSETGSSEATTSTEYYRVRRSWEDESSQIGAWEKLELAKAACKAGYTVYDWNGKAVYTTGGAVASGKTESTSVGSITTTNKTELIKAGQTHANNFCGAGIVVDGIRGSATKKAGIKVLQTAMNMDYKAGLVVDGIWGSKSDAALKGHTVRQGETQYMITALEILLLLKGYSPNGVECPGVFGSGCATATGQYQADNGLAVDKIAGYNTFKSLIA